MLTTLCIVGWCGFCLVRRLLGFKLLVHARRGGKSTTPIR